MAMLELKNAEMNRIISHPTEPLIGVAGKRTAYLLRYGDSSIDMMHHYLDEEVNENFTCLEFYGIEESLYLAVAGVIGIVKMINVTKHSFDGYLRGHGGAITEIRIGGLQMNLLFSASEDTTIRMWNLKTRRCLAIFGGYVGHRDYVLSIDVSLCGKRLVSSGSDCTVKIWDIPQANPEAIFPVYFPTFSSYKLHKSYIGCCKFYGELVISKSTSHKLAIIHPNYETAIYNISTSSDCLFIDEFKADADTGLTYKFSLDGDLLVMAGSENSQSLYVFDLNSLGKGFVPEIYKTGKEGIKDIFVKGLHIFILYNDSKIQIFKIKH